MTAPDPQNPKVGDRFTSRDGHKIEVRFVDHDGVVFFRYTEHQNSPGFATSFNGFVATPEPLITRPTKLFEHRSNTGHQFWDSERVHRMDTGQLITILPDGTWHEGPS